MDLEPASTRRAEVGLSTPLFHPAMVGGQEGQENISSCGYCGVGSDHECGRRDREGNKLLSQLMAIVDQYTFTLSRENFGVGLGIGQKEIEEMASDPAGTARHMVGRALDLQALTDHILDFVDNEILNSLRRYGQQSIQVTGTEALLREWREGRC